MGTLKGFELPEAAIRAGRVGGNLAKNALAPLAGPIRARRGSLGLDNQEGGVLRALADLAPALESWGTSLDGATVVELGPGRTPDLGIALLLAGAARLTWLDVDLQLPQDSLDAGRYSSLAAALVAEAPDAATCRNACHADRASITDRCAELATRGIPATAVRYDGTTLPLEDKTVDLVISNAVLEHVRALAIEPLLADLLRVLRPGGAMVHAIDLRDHCHLDGVDGATGDWLEALRYSDRLFDAMFSRRSTYINRARAMRWREAVEAAGFRVLHWEERRLPLPRSFDRNGLYATWRDLPRSELEIAGLRVAACRP